MTNEEKFEKLLTKKAELQHEALEVEEQISQALEDFEVGITININGLPYRSTRRAGGKLFLRCMIPKSVQGEMRSLVAGAVKGPSVQWKNAGKKARESEAKPAKKTAKKTAKKAKKAARK